MSLTNSPIWFGSGATGGGFYPVQINDSLRFNDNDSPSLSKTYAAAQTNTKKLTISVWVKRGTLGIRSTILFANSGSAGKLSFQTTDKIYFNAFDTGYNGFESYALFRDTSAWYHIVAQADSAGQTGANINRVWVNGVELSNNKTSVFVPNNTDTMLLRNGVTTYIGDDTAGAYHFDGYLAEMNVIDGSIVAPTEFGETKDGVWIPKSYGGSYGTNGFYLNFSNNSTATNLGLDSSGNSNNWSVNNIATTDQIIDTPTNNFSVMNAVEPSSGVSATLSEGNLKTVGTTVSYSGGIASTFEQSSGKWYWEVYVNSEVTAGSNFYSFVGAATGDNNLIHKSNNSQIPTVAAGVNGWSWEGDGTINLSGTGTKAVTSVTAPNAGDVLGFAIDLDNGDVYFYHNGTAQNSGNAVITGVTGLVHNPMVGVYNGSTVTFNFGQDSTFAGATTAGGNSDANGRGDFKYAVPSAHLALCTANLPEPTIIDASEYFNTVLFSATGGVAGSVTGYGFAPDWLWTKARNAVQSHQLFDNVRGDNNILYSNLTNAESAQGAGYFTLEADGFNYGTSTFSSNTYVGWGWKAGTSVSGTTTGNGTGKPYTGSVNTDSGFSIIGYTGNGTAGHTIPHHLGVAPKMVITKKRSATGSWGTYHVGLTSASYYILLNDTTAQASNNVYFNGTAPTDSVVTRGTGADGNANNETYIQYAFADVDGYSKMGSYVGNGSSDGPFVYTGFRPAWLMIKRTDAAADWIIWDDKRNTYNELTEFLYPNGTYAEATGSGVADLLSNGFKLRNAGVSNRNASGGNYAYLAFAENPFKYANAR